LYLQSGVRLDIAAIFSDSRPHLKYGHGSTFSTHKLFVFFTCPQNEQVHPTSGHMSSHALTDFNGFTHQCDPSPIVAMGFSWTTSPYSPLMFSPGIDVCIQRHIANMALPGLIFTRVI
jgi:hypothetical protein